MYGEGAANASPKYPVTSHNHERQVAFPTGCYRVISWLRCRKLEDQETRRGHDADQLFDIACGQCRRQVLQNEPAIYEVERVAL